MAEMVRLYQLPYHSEVTVDFETAPNKPASSIAVMHVDGTISVDNKKVSLKLRSLGAHSQTMHAAPGKHVGPCPTLVVFKVEAVSGTAGPHGAQAGRPLAASKSQPTDP